MDGGGHHMVDAEGQNGLEPRAVDDTLIDEMLHSGMLDLESDNGS